MHNLTLSLRFWITLFIGLPLLVLGAGILLYLIIGANLPMWGILSTIAPAASALATMCLAFAALIGITTNLRTVNEMEKTRKVQTTPSIVAYFDNPTSILIEFVVKNIGYGAAKEVRLNIDPPLLDHKNRNISELSLFKEGIKFFPPNREFRQIVGTSRQFFDKDAPRPLQYELLMSYQDAEGNMYEQAISLDLSVYRDLPIHRESDIDKLTKEVAELRKAIAEHEN